VPVGNFDCRPTVFCKCHANLISCNVVLRGREPISGVQSLVAAAAGIDPRARST
jgi:hypothetical protein